MKYSLIIPVYNNESTIPSLLNEVSILNSQMSGKLEGVFIVDGSPDNSLKILRDLLEASNLNYQILVHARNFGSFAAIRTGLMAAKGEFFAVMSADLQEPISLISSFFEVLDKDHCDLAIGKRIDRDDPFFSKLASHTFWTLYRYFVMPEIPKGGVDVFGCNIKARNTLLQLEESHSSLVSLIFWMGFRKQFIEFTRAKRPHGTSSWTWKKKLKYMMDSIFSFTDIPIKLIIRSGLIGLILSVALGAIVLFARIFYGIDVPGYATTILVILFFGVLNLLGIGLVGSYVWRTYENSKHRPHAIISMIYSNDPLIPSDD